LRCVTPPPPSPPPPPPPPAIHLVGRYPCFPRCGRFFSPLSSFFCPNDRRSGVDSTRPRPGRRASPYAPGLVVKIVVFPIPSARGPSAFSCALRLPFFSIALFFFFPPLTVFVFWERPSLQELMKSSRTYSSSPSLITFVVLFDALLPVRSSRSLLWLAAEYLRIPVYFYPNKFR